MRVRKLRRDLLSSTSMQRNSNSTSFFPPPYRLSDSAPPLKRQRTSTPRPHHASTPPIDINAEREASTLRMLDVWSQLAQRYTRRLDEDDIIDLRTDKIVKDRGVLRASSVIKFGSFADPDPPAVHRTESDDGDGEVDPDVDELDMLSGPTPLPEQAIAEVVKRLPPVRAVDPADAQDLKAFLEAERLRRVTCGSDLDEEDQEELTETDQDEDVQTQTEVSSNPPDDNGDDEIHQDQVDNRRSEYSHSHSQFLAQLQDESEDELGAWSEDDGTTIIAHHHDDGDSEVDPPTLSPSPLPRPMSTRSRPILPTPVDDTPTPTPPPIPRAKHITTPHMHPRSQLKPKPLFTPPPPPTTPTPTSMNQLQTPPKSSSEPVSDYNNVNYEYYRRECFIPFSFSLCLDCYVPLLSFISMLI